MDLILWGICALFIAWEAFAHFIAKNREAHTLSNRVWALEARYPKTRGVVALIMIALTLHLALGWL